MLGLSRAALYYQAVQVHAYELVLMALLDFQYLRTPFYGSWRMTAWLQTQSHAVNRKRVQCLMQRRGLAAIYQRPRPPGRHHADQRPDTCARTAVRQPGVLRAAKGSGLKLPAPPLYCSRQRAEGNLDRDSQMIQTVAQPVSPTQA